MDKNKQELTTNHQKEAHLKHKNISLLGVKGGRKVYHANSKQERAGKNIPISGKVDLRTRTRPGMGRGHYRVMKGCALLEDIPVLNSCVPNNTTSNYTK